MCQKLIIREADKSFLKLRNFIKKLFKAQAIRREFKEKRNKFNVEKELQKLEQKVSTTTSEQTEELRNKLDEHEQKLEATSKQTKELGNKLEELDNKLEEILKFLKRQ